MNKTTFAAFLLTFFMFFNVFGQNDELQFKPRPASYEFYQNFGDTLIVSLGFIFCGVLCTHCYCVSHAKRNNSRYRGFSKV